MSIASNPYEYGRRLLEGRLSRPRAARTAV